MFYFYKMMYFMVSKKKIHYTCDDGTEKSVPCNHRLSSLGKPRDAKLWTRLRRPVPYGLGPFV